MSSGTCPSSLLDRVEREATSGLLTVLAGRATAGGSRCPVENPATPLPREVGIPVSECLVRIDLLWRTAAGRVAGSRQDEEFDLDSENGHRHRGPRAASGQPGLRARRPGVVRPPLPDYADDLERLWARLPADQRPEDLTVVMEPTRNAWVPLAAWFRRRGAQVVLVSAERSSDLRAYYAKHTKSDRLDSTSSVRTRTRRST